MTPERAPGTIRILGDIMIDIIARTAGDPVRGSDRTADISEADGGSAANVAAWLAALGARVELIARVGVDAGGDAVLGRLIAAGVQVSVARDPQRSTGRCIVIVTPDGERTMLPDPGANASLSVADIATRDWLPVDHLHVSGYSLLHEGPRPAALEALDRARERGLSISVDASSSGPLAHLGPARFLDWLHAGEIVFANAEEARILTGESDDSGCVMSLLRRGLLPVVKLGDRGALGGQAHQVWQVPAQPAEATDTTGAGDAFAAGFLASWTQHADMGHALDSATRTAARAVARPGGRP